MVTADGQQAVLMDLGLAQLADDVHGKLTRTRQFVGTLRYASPEQILAVGGVDRRSDVYSLGASLWELLTLRPMFGATEQTPTPELMQRIQYEEPEPVRRHHPGVPRDLEAIVHKCLAKDPRRRYETAAELVDDLQRFLDGDSVRARREHPARRLWRKAWRRPAATTLALVAIVAAASLAVAVPQAIRAQRIADLTAQLGDLIERGEASESDVGLIDRLMAQLEPLAPQQAAIRRKQVLDRLARRIDEQIRTEPTVEPEDEARLRAQIGLLAPRDSARSKELERHLAQRVRSWQEVARLDPPFERVDRAFEPSRVAVDGGGLGPRAPDAPTAGIEPASTTFLPSLVACQGNAQLHVTLRAGSWDTSRGIGLFLYDNQWHTGPIRGLAYARGDKALAVSDERGLTRIWDIPSHSSTILPSPPSGSLSLAFGLPGGKEWRPDAGTPELRDVALGEDIREGRSVRVGQLVAAVGPAGRAVALAAPGGRVMLLAARERSLHLVREYRLKGREIICLALADAGRLLAAGALDGTISLLDPASETPRILKGHTGEVNALAFHRDGALLASGGADTKVHLWDAAKASPGSVLSGHEAKVTALAFSPDGRTLASGGLDGKVRLWNLAAERSGDPLAGHAAAVSGLAFSSNEGTLAVAHGPRVTIWDTRTSRSLEVLRPQHYALRLLAPRPARALGSRGVPQNPVTLREAIAAGHPLVVQLARDDQILREQDVTLMSGRPLVLSAKLEGGKLELVINGTQSVVFQDIFPLGHTARGSFALDLPATARIEHLVASCQRPPEQKSGMEQGDEFYANGEPSRALEAYREQERNAANAEVAQEAKCKQGVCLADLGRAEDAIRIFEDLEAETGDRWPIIAGCRLWLLHLQQRHLDEASAVHNSLFSQRRLERIAALVPADIPAAIVNAYAPASSYVHIMRNPKLIPNLELALAIVKEIRAPVGQQLSIRWLLALAYHEDGQFERAAKAFADLLDRPILLPSDEALVIENYGWVLGQLKKNRVALEELDRRIATGREASPLLFICRAQVRARMGEWAASRDDIDEFFRRHTDQDGQWLYDACLIRGFIREALGDADGAINSWRAGYRAASGTGDMSLLSVSILGSLSGELTADDVRIMFNTVLGMLPSNVAPMKIVENLNFSFEDLVSGLRTVWSSPRGREYARKIALLNLPFSEYFQIQVPLTVAEVCRYGAFGGTLSPDDDELLWAMVQSLFRDYLALKVSETNSMALMTIWLGYPLTWRLASRALQPGTRGLIAYTFGARYEHLGRPTDAALFFQAALSDSAPGTLLRRRAQAAFDRLSASK
jgi:tetratricopeptide (TPR) repeat protein